MNGKYITWDNHATTPLKERKNTKRNPNQIISYCKQEINIENNSQVVYV